MVAPAKSMTPAKRSPKFWRQNEGHHPVDQSLPSPSALSPTRYRIMFRRALTQQSRVFRFSISARSFSTPSSISRSELPRRPIQPSSLTPPSPRLFQRWQSTDTEQKPQEDPPPSEEAEEQDPWQVELEAKNREIVDLKVCRISSWACPFAPSTLNPPHHPSP